MIFYSSDWHLGHANILRLSQRPFSNVEEMNKAIIDNYKATVTDKDDFYFLGDAVFKCPEPPDKLFANLPGRKHLIIGNHDKSIMSTASRYFVSVSPYKEITDNGRKVVLCHYPLLEWNGFFHGAYHLYGHIHNNFDTDTYKIIRNVPRAFNVGVDVNDFRPVTLDELIKKNPNN